MKTLTEHLSQYGAYHRDRRNIITHLIGIPLIVVAVAILLSRPGINVYGLWVSPALIVASSAAVVYLRLDLRLGIAMSIMLTVSVWLAMFFAQQSTSIWLSWGITGFAVGWVVQFIGHYYVGR